MVSIRRFIKLATLFICFSSYGQVIPHGVISSSNRASTAAQRFIDEAGVTNTTEKNATKRLVADLNGVPNGSYTVSNIFWKFLAIYPFEGSNTTIGSYNIINTSRFQLTFFNSPTIDANGYEGNVSSYAKTGIVPSTDMTINSTALCISIGGTTIDVGTNSDISSNVSGTQRLNIRARFSGDLFISDQYSTAAEASTSNTTGGTFISSRYSSAGFSILKDGVVVGTHNATGGTLPNLEIPIGASNSAGVFSSVGAGRNYRFASFSKGLTDVESTNLYNAINNFNITLGR